MTPHQALTWLRKNFGTLDEIRKCLGKNRVKTSVTTLWRILEDKDYPASYKLANAIIGLCADQKRALSEKKIDNSWTVTK